MTRFYLLINTKIIIKKNRNYRIFVPTSHKKSSVFRSAGLRMTLMLGNNYACVQFLIRINTT